MPTATTTTPIMNNQPDIGSNNTSNIPKPNPIKQTAIVFLSTFNIIIYLPSFVYYIRNIFYLFLFYGYLAKLVTRLMFFYKIL